MDGIGIGFLLWSRNGTALSGQASFHICSKVEREFSPSCGLILSADFAHKNVAVFSSLWNAKVLILFIKSPGNLSPRYCRKIDRNWPASLLNSLRNELNFTYTYVNRINSALSNVVSFLRVLHRTSRQGGYDCKNFTYTRKYFKTFKRFRSTTWWW